MDNMPEVPPKKHKRGRRKKFQHGYQEHHRAQLAEQLERRFQAENTGNEPSTSAQIPIIEKIPLPSEVDFSTTAVTEEDYQGKDYMNDPPVISTHSAEIQRSPRFVRKAEDAERYILQKAQSTVSTIYEDFRNRLLVPLRHEKSLVPDLPRVEFQRYSWEPEERKKTGMKRRRVRHDIDEEEEDEEEEGAYYSSSEEEDEGDIQEKLERRAQKARERALLAEKNRLFLERKRNHPNAFDSEISYNEKGLANDGPECKCAPEALGKGVKHGKYPGEEKFQEKCTESSKLYHYVLKVLPAPNENQVCKTSMKISGNEFLFEGFSILTHQPLPECMTQRSICRYPLDYEYTILEEMIPQECYSPQETTLLYEYLFHDVFEMLDFNLFPSDSATCPVIHLMPRFACYKPDGVHLWSTKTVMGYFLWKATGNADFSQRQAILLNGSVKPSAIRADWFENEYFVNNSVRNTNFSPRAKGRITFLERKLQKEQNGSGQVDPVEVKRIQTELDELRAKTSRTFQVRKSTMGYRETGLKPDVTAHVVLTIIAAHHIRYNFGISEIENVVKYKFSDRRIFELAMTHSSLKVNYGIPTDHVRTLLNNCGYRKKYGNDDRRERKRGIVSMYDIISGQQDTEPILHNERLEYLGDAVVELIVSHHLFFMLPHHLEGGLATYRTALVQNRNLASLAINCRLDELLLFSHGNELSNEADWRHALANAYEAFMAAVYLDGGMDECDRIYSESMWAHDPEQKATWDHVNEHELKREDPHGDREISLVTPTLKNFHKLEELLGIQFNNIRLLAKAFTRRHIPYNDMTKGHNQRLEWLGDSVLQLHVTDYLYRHFPNHHEGHMSLLRTSLVSNETQSVICDDLGFPEFSIKAEKRGNELKMKDKADLVEAFIGALYVDQGMAASRCFVRMVFLPRLNHFINNEKWNDAKSHLQQWCLMLRDATSRAPEVPDYRVISKEGPTNSRIYSVAVYFRNQRLALVKHSNIHKAELMVAELALKSLEKYDPRDIATFLEFVEEDPILWYPSHMNYQCKELRQQAADEIEEKCTKFMPRGKIHGNVALKLFKDLQRDYKLHQAAIENARNGSGKAISHFPYAENMQFLNGDAPKKGYGNAYIIGSAKHQVLELSDKNKKREETSKRKPENLTLETPKRLRKSDHMDMFFEKWEQSNEELLRAIKSVPLEEPSCASDRICRTFKEHVKDWPEIEKLTAEAKIVNFIRTLKF